jgi:hypothetical protein
MPNEGEIAVYGDLPATRYFDCPETSQRDSAGRIFRSCK